MSPPPQITSQATLRPFSCELTTLTSADGSAVWKSGGTAVLASVHGPAAPRQASLEDPTGAQISCIVQHEPPAADHDEWETLLRHVLEGCVDRSKYPRCVVQVVCHVLQGDGSVLVACLHAAVLALLDAGVALHQLPTAVSLRVCRDDETSNSETSQSHYQIALDPDEAAEQDLDRQTAAVPSALVTLVVVETSHTKNAAAATTPLTVLATHTVGGPTPLAAWATLLALAGRARPALTHFWQLALQQKFQQRLPSA